MWNLIRWLNQKSTDLDVQCFRETENLGSAGQRLRKRIIEDNLSLARFYHISAPAKLKKDKTTTKLMESKFNFKLRKAPKQSKHLKLGINP